MALVAMSNVTRETADLICKRLGYTNSVDWFGLEIFGDLWLSTWIQRDNHNNAENNKYPNLIRNSEKYVNW